MAERTCSRAFLAQVVDRTSGRFVGWASFDHLSASCEFDLAGRRWRADAAEYHQTLILRVEAVTAGLSELDDAILDLAANPPRDPGETGNRIRELGMSEVTFYRRLNELLDTEAALRAYPLAVNRLRMLRGGRRRWVTGTATMRVTPEGVSVDG